MTRAYFPFRLAAVDLDGTLLAPDKTIPKANFEAVHLLRSLGCEVILASGRRHEDILPIYHELNLDAPIISSDGILVKQPLSEEVFYEQLIEPAVAQGLIKEGLERGYSIFVYHAESAFYSEHDDLTSRYQAITRSRKPILHRNLHTLNGTRIHKIVWCGNPSKLLFEQKRLAELFQKQLVVCESDPGYLEFMPLLSGKYAALSHLAEHLGVPAHSTLAFGDNWNDVEILSRVAFGVAMTHASLEARQAAKAVAPDGDEAESFSRAVNLVLDKFSPVCSSR
ncbi:MAG: Cof-type HAD-IIB family hydrolase [Cyanobacteria bacterium REEB67]|nr:Cof-type HAD-IIB family hydrolase [Cyanobacteria bacterium REEB67]